MSKRIPMLRNKTLIRGYADQISDGMKGVAAQMLEVGKIVLEAEEQLGSLDLEKLKAEGLVRSAGNFTMKLCFSFDRARW
jgi:hypothetical protein